MFSGIKAKGVSGAVWRPEIELVAQLVARLVARRALVAARRAANYG